MAKLLKLRRGTDTQHSTFTGAEGEVTVNTTNDSLHVHDGTTAGGTELAKADLSNVDGSLSNNLGFADGTKALFGTGNDLEIYHNGSDSVISDLGTGDLYIKSSSTFIRTGTNESMANFNADGSVQLYHDNSQKLATTSSGINVTGTVTCDGIQSDGTATIAASSGQVIVRDNDNSATASQSTIRFQDSNATQLGVAGYVGTANMAFSITNSQNDEIRLGTNGTDRLALSADGSVFYPVSNNALDLGGSSQQFRNAYFDGAVNCDGLDCDGAADITVPSAAEATPLRVHNSTSGGNTRLLISSLANGSGDPFIKFDAGGTDMSVGLLWASGANTLRLGPGTNPASITGLQIDQSGHCLPTANNTLDLGSNSLRWRNVYTNDLNLSNEGGSNDVDGTWGSWTIQEGEDDLFLLNRRNGKKYKFNLSEVN